MHSGKGLLGLRLDAVYDVEISNLFMHIIYIQKPNLPWCNVLW